MHSDKWTFDRIVLKNHINITTMYLISLVSLVVGNKIKMCTFGDTQNTINVILHEKCVINVFGKSNEMFSDTRPILHFPCVWPLPIADYLIQHHLKSDTNTFTVPVSRLTLLTI